MKNPEVVIHWFRVHWSSNLQHSLPHIISVFMGVDINPKVVDIINKGKIHIVEPDLDELLSKKLFQTDF